MNISELLSTINTPEDYAVAKNVLIFLESEGLLADYPQTIKVVKNFLDEKFNKIMDEMAGEQ